MDFKQILIKPATIFGLLFIAVIILLSIFSGSQITNNYYLTHGSNSSNYPNNAIFYNLGSTNTLNANIVKIHSTGYIKFNNTYGNIIIFNQGNAIYDNLSITVNKTGINRANSAIILNASNTIFMGSLNLFNAGSDGRGNITLGQSSHIDGQPSVKAYLDQYMNFYMGEFGSDWHVNSPDGNPELDVQSPFQSGWVQVDNDSGYPQFQISSINGTTNGFGNFTIYNDNQTGSSPMELFNVSGADNETYVYTNITINQSVKSKGYYASGQKGITDIITIQKSLATTCTLTITNGIITGTTC